MKKIPTLLRRDPDNRAKVLDEVTPGCEWVMAGDGRPTRKYDGVCVLIVIGRLIHLSAGERIITGYVRRNVKPGKPTPDGFIHVETDPVTGITFGWEPVHGTGFHRFFEEAVTNHNGAEMGPLVDGTYELCGPRINGNPEGLDQHLLFSHDRAETVGFALDHPLGFQELREGVALLAPWEGVVWHHDDGRMAKLKRRDL